MRENSFSRRNNNKLLPSHMTTQMQEKVAETDVILREVAEVSQKYEPLARACSDIFFTLESLSQLHFLYQVKQLLVRVCV